MNWLETGIGYDITLWFNKMGDGFFGYLLRIFDFTGGEGFYILAFPFIYWCINKSLGKRLIIITLLTSYINLVLKDLFARPRPYNVSVKGKDQIINRLNDLDTYGLPSGHAMGSTVYWGFLSKSGIKKSAKIVCYLVILLTAISRMVHGVHFVQDVVLGIALGLIVIILFSVIEPKVTTLCNEEYTLLQRLLLVFFSTGAALVLAVLINADNMRDIITVTGGFLGAMSGIVLEKEYINFSVDGNLSVRLGRYILGLGVVVTVYIGLKYLFEILGLDNQYFRFFRYVLVGLVTTYPVPKLFILLKLAESKLK